MRKVRCSLRVACLQVALWTLGQLLSSSGQIEKAYFKYRPLLDVLLNILKVELLPSIRREVRCFAAGMSWFSRSTDVSCVGVLYSGCHYLDSVQESHLQVLLLVTNASPRNSIKALLHFWMCLWLL